MSKNKLRMPKAFLLFLAVTLCVFVSPNTYAEQVKIDNEMQKQACNDVEKSPVSKASDYPQKLSKTIVVEEEFYHHDLDSYVRYIPSRKVGAQPGKVGIIDSAMEYSYSMKVFDQLPIEFGLGVNSIGITNTTVVKLPSRLMNIFFGAETTLPFFSFRNTYFTVALAPKFHTDNWAIRSSAFSLQPYSAIFLYLSGQ